MALGSPGLADGRAPPPGYTQEEKIEIAHRHLIPKQLDQHGLTPQQLQIPPATTLGIITRSVHVLGCFNTGVPHSGRSQPLPAREHFRSHRCAHGSA